MKKQIKEDSTSTSWKPPGNRKKSCLQCTKSYKTKAVSKLGFATNKPTACVGTCMTDKDLALAVVSKQLKAAVLSR